MLTILFFGTNRPSPGGNRPVLTPLAWWRQRASSSPFRDRATQWPALCSQRALSNGPTDGERAARSSTGSLWPDGSSEDPSLLLGMGGAAKAKERHEEERKLAERMVDFVEGVKANKYVETVFGKDDFDDDAFSVEVDGCP